MKLSQIISEASLPLWEFSYPEYEHDPTPKVIVLGTYVHPETGNKLLMGINARLLNTQQAVQMVGMVNDLTKIKDGRIRVKYLRTRASRIFDTAYRTYDLNKMSMIDKSTISNKGPAKKTEPVKQQTSIPTVKQPEIKQPEKPTEVPTLDKDLANSKINKERPQKTPYVDTPVQKPIEPAEDPLATTNTTVPQVDNSTSTGETNVGNTETVQKKTERSKRGLGSLSERPKNPVQRPDSTVSDMENEEY